MKKTAIDVSFVIIAYNEELAIGACIESIQMQNGLKDYEVIVINDASTDHTAQVVAKYISTSQHIRLVSLPTNKGRGYARDAGVKLAKGTYIAFVDADIILPKHWLATCLKHIDQYDAVGGVAVPDGDVAYVHRLCKLDPKATRHTTSITGNNGLFKRDVLTHISIDPKMRDGEDVDLTWRLEKTGIQTKSISNLVCTHNEYKSFLDSIKWLYQQGIGANNLWRMYHRTRLPDLTFLAFAGLIVLTCLFILKYPVLIFLPFTYSYIVSLIHLRMKFIFHINTLPNMICASLVHAIMITAYLFGRLTSTPLLLKDKSIV